MVPVERGDELCSDCRQVGVRLVVRENLEGLLDPVGTVGEVALEPEGSAETRCSLFVRRTYVVAHELPLSDLR